MDIDQAKIDRLIANLMSASAPVEEYLRQAGPLTVQQLELVSATISGLQTFLDVWKRKHNMSALDTSFLSKFKDIAK